MSPQRPPDWAAFGRYVELRRTEQGLRIVDALKRSGLSRTKWADIENNRGGVPTRETLLAVARGLDVPPGELFGRVGITYTEVPGEPLPPDRVTDLERRLAEVEEELRRLRDLEERVSHLRLVDPSPPDTE